MNLTIPNLIQAIEQWKGTETQTKAVRWLQASVGPTKQETFAALWRDRAGMGQINFIDVFRYYRGLNQQNAALDWLQGQIGDSVLKEFFRLYSLRPAAVKLPVVFFPQTDNFTQAERTCNSSSSAMVCNYLTGGKPKTDDEYLRIVLGYGDTTDHNVQTKALRRYGVESVWRTDLRFKDLDAQLDKGIPVTCGILHRGTVAAPTGGHIIVVIGRTSDGHYICNDPYGSIHDGYLGPVMNGKGVIYQRPLLAARWTVDGDGSGWGRIFERLPQI